MSLSNLHRRGFLLSASLLAAAPLAAGQEYQDFSKTQIKVTPVRDGIYMLQGAGGNIGACVGDDGIAIVDDEFAPLAEKIRAALRDITGADKPVRYVINTHCHWDHTDGNLAFCKTSTIIAHDNARKSLASGYTQGNGGTIHRGNKPVPLSALPIITFGHDISVHLNGEDIQALHHPACHTDSDAIIYYPHANVVHMGDIFVRYGFPFIDIDSGGNIQGMIMACDTVLRKLPQDVKIIPGHGELATMNDLRAFSVMLQETTEAVRKALKEGKTLAEMKQQRIMSPWHRFATDFFTEDVQIETVYNSLTGNTAGMFTQHR